MRLLKENSTITQECFGADLNYIRTFLVHEKIQIDRKVKYIFAILITFLGFGYIPKRSLGMYCT